MRARKKGTLLVAMDRYGAIGNQGMMPWETCRADMHLFRLITSGGAAIVGRKTFDKMGRLRDRVNIVLTRGRVSTEGGAIRMNDMVGAHHLAWQLGLPIFYIGGEQVYRQALGMDLVDTMYITTLDTKCDKVDAWFPTVDFSQWAAACRMDLTAGAYVTKYMRKKQDGKEAWQ